MPPRLQNFAEYDELTDLPTMMYFRRYAGAYVKKSHRVGHKAYLVFFNLENFSTFNERYGFEAGDQLLRLTAVTIQGAFPGFLLSRFAEDHFFLVCESHDLGGSIRDVRACVHAYGRHANVELKAGVYQLEEDEFDIGLACDRAKMACESIAHRYDRTFRWFDDALNWYMERSHYVESHIDKAVENGWIKVYYQPIVRTVTGKVCEFEALARWDDPRYGMLSPEIFVEVLEKAHLIHKLDTYVIHKACEMWRELNGSGNTVIPVSVNLSRLDFELCDTFRVVEDATQAFGIPRQMLHVEVTESALNENPDQLIETVARFRSAGYQVWLDDFGSGYSSLNTLKDYVFDVVKIDMAFLREFNTKPKSRIIIASIVNMAKQLGMQTLIEGVELPEQFEFVKEIGCEFVQGYLIGRPATIEQNLLRIRSGELVMGETSLYGYYDRLGAINTLSATPFDFPWEMDPSEDRTLTEMIPLAIVERRMGEIRLLTANQRFEREMRGIGIKSSSEIAMYLNDARRSQARTINRTIDAAISSAATETVDIMENGMHAVMRVRHVVSHGNVDALLVSVTNLSHFTNVNDESRLRIAMQYLYSVYDEVNIVDVPSGVVSTIYRGNTAFPWTEHDELFTHAVRRFVDTFVHPSDRERCVRYLDITDIEERVESSGRSYLAEAFRILKEDGTYAWFTSVLVPILVDGQNTVLVCLRGANEEVLSSMQVEDEIPKSLLWDTLLDLVPAGVFWKDADRRFLGVNKNFLDFYSFESTNDVLGKNDEDMGWHVDADPFKENELRVITEGEPVLNARGTCIAQGEVRDILASKIPLRRNGEVVGLLGYFTDHTDGNVGARRLMFDGFNRMAETDPLTGIPNLRGLSSSAMSYKDAYERGGSDFACMVIDICDMNSLNDVYGRSFGNRILKVVALRLTHLSGVRGVVARIGGDKFAALHQVETAEEGMHEMRRLCDELEGIQEIDGMRVHLRCLCGMALFSEGSDFGEVLSLADERMKEAREAYSSRRNAEHT